MTDLTGLIPHGWSGGEAVTKWWRGKHLHLYRLRKNCAQCGKEMVLDVTKAAIVGSAKNAGLHLSRCSGCRAGSRAEGATSRPFTREDKAEIAAPQKAIGGVDPEEFAAVKAERDEYSEGIMNALCEGEKLRKQVQELKTELEHTFKELQVAKAKLTKYEPELQQSMREVARFKPPKMPWET